MRRIVPLTLSILCLALACAACVKLQRQPLDKRYYALEVSRPASASGVATPALTPETLLVRRLEVAPRVAGRELVYRTAPSDWTGDFYNQFFVTPADMLTQDLRAWLSSARVFANVVEPSSLAPTRYSLEGNVSSLHGDFAVNPPLAVAEMQFMLLEDAPEGRRIVFTRQYRRTAPLAARSPQALVEALRQAVTDVYAGLEADLRAAMAAKR